MYCATFVAQNITPHRRSLGGTPTGGLQSKSYSGLIKVRTRGAILVPKRGFIRKLENLQDLLCVHYNIAFFV